MAGPIRIAILANGAQARREISATSSALGGLGKFARTTAATAGIASLTAGVVGLAKSAVSTEAKYSTTMRLIAAATKTPASEMERLSDLAVDMGAKTQFSATEAADAMLELAKAGLDTNTIMGGGLAGTLTLAAAGGTELGTAATIASNALNTFKLRGRDMDRVAAALAGGANASTASVESLGQALSQVGPGATNAGLSLNETVAALAALDSAGVKGSDSGTALKTMLARLVPQTEKARGAMEELGLDFVKGNGEFESLENIAGQLQRRLGGLSDAQRTTALSTIFGSDASRAATVLVNQGADGVRKFIKATNDQNAAQEMAKARTEGTAGALERLGGAVETAQLRLGQELAPIVEKSADGLADKLVPAVDSVIDGAKELGEAVAPAFEAVTEAIGDLLPDGESAASMFNDQLVPAVRTLADLVAGAVGIIDDLPDPLKDIALQGAAVAFVLPKVQAGFTTAQTAVAGFTARTKQAYAEMTYAETRAQRASAAMGRLGGAAKVASGVGGIAALSAGADTGNKALQGLANIGGGALLGFAAGGPIGAALGAGAGLLTTLTTNTDASREAFELAAPSAQEYADTLHDLSGASTEATRALAYQRLEQAGVLAQLEAEGFTRREAVNAVTRDGAARQKLADYIALERQQLESYLGASENLSQAKREEIQARLDNLKRIEDETQATDRAVKDKQREGSAIAEYRGALRGLPKQVRTDIRAGNVPNTMREVADLTRRYNLTPKQIRTVLELTGVGASVREIRKIVSAAEGGGRDVASKFRTETRKTKADLGPFDASVRSGAGKARGTASSGGNEVGSALKAGVIVGFSGTATALSAMAAAAVRSAVASAKAAGRIQSPSKEMAYVGEMLGRGMRVGLASEIPGLSDTAQGLVAVLTNAFVAPELGQAVQAVTDQYETLTAKIREETEKQLEVRRAAAEKDYDREQERIRRTLKGKAEERALREVEKAHKAHLDRLDRRYAETEKTRIQQATRQRTRALAEARAWDAVTAQIEKQREVVDQAKQAWDDHTAKLEDARSTLRSMQDAATSYATTMREKVVGSIIGLGQSTDVNGRERVNSTSLVTQLRERAEQAKAFVQRLNRLVSMNLNKDTIQELLEAGPEAASATAMAIEAGGLETVNEINALTAQLTVAGDELGALGVQHFHQAGIDTAQSLVDALALENANVYQASYDAAGAVLSGLEAQRAAIEASAAAIAKAITDSLGLKQTQKEAEEAGSKIGQAVHVGTKTKLKIKSPSRVFRDVGRDVVAGLRIGTEDGVGRVGEVMARELVSSFGEPPLTARALDSGRAGDASAPVRVELVVSADQLMDAAMRGAAIQADLDVYHDAGGRGVAVVGAA